jgi:hypothetical protein
MQWWKKFDEASFNWVHDMVIKCAPELQQDSSKSLYSSSRHVSRTFFCPADYFPPTGGSHSC